MEVHVDCPIEICEKTRCEKIYIKKARAGEISHFTGIDSPFEEPVNPDIKVKHRHSIFRGMPQ